MKFSSFPQEKVTRCINNEGENFLVQNKEIRAEDSDLQLTKHTATSKAEVDKTSTLLEDQNAI